MNRSRLAGLLVSTTFFLSALAHAGGPALVRVDRRGSEDREGLIAAGVPIVMEREDLFLALGDSPQLWQQLGALGRTGVVVDADTSGFTYFAAGLRAGTGAAELVACGEVVLAESEWALFRTTGDLSASCEDSSKWFLRKLPMRPLRPSEVLPEPYASWQRGDMPLLDAHPVVQLIVDSLTPATIQATWEEIVNVATTRASTSAGCVTATDHVYGEFQALGLNPVKQNHTSGHAPNVIGTITGYSHPERMAVFLLRSKHGAAWAPPASTGTVFSDVPIDYWAGDFIEALAAEGITLGCAVNQYCPEVLVTRAEMALFLLRTEHGSGWVPPSATGAVFTDVPAGHWAGDFIEALAAEGITLGCGIGLYCPAGNVTRAEMAVFLTRTFGFTPY
jgi:hypothetical protein